MLMLSSYWFKYSLFVQLSQSKVTNLYKGPWVDSWFERQRHRHKANDLISSVMIHRLEHVTILLGGGVGERLYLGKPQKKVISLVAGPLTGGEAKRVCH